MIIVNADDFGRSRAETDIAISCYAKGRITSATAMVFMADSDRSAELAKDANIELGLHLNLSQPFTAPPLSKLRDRHDRIVRFITSSPYAIAIYNPMLRRDFRYVYQAQFDEFTRLYEKLPSHVDGHHHRHLCANLLFDGIIPLQTKVRRNFSFRAGEKNALNRMYRGFVDGWLARRYTVTDYFFSLQQMRRDGRLHRVFELSKTSAVELMTHPVNEGEYAYLMSEQYARLLDQVRTGSYASL